MILGLLNVDAMIAGDANDVDEYHPQLVALRQDLRDKLRELVRWARETGRM